MIIKRVSDFLKKYQLEDKTLIVGFSGGYDSMCLIDVLSKLQKQPEFNEMTLIAAHFNHNWRGEESYKEQEICRLYSQARGIEFYTKTAPSDLKKTENDARIARYEFFEEAYDEFDADAVLTAHNRDDNAETLLYRIIKGTGIVGLKGIPPKREFFYRPLITTYRKDIEEYCKNNNLTPNVDSSNSNTTYKRNYIRLTVIPALEKINPEVKEALNTLAENANSDNAIIEEYMKNVKPLVFDGESLRPQEYKKLSLPVKKRILYDFIQKLGLDFDSKKIKEIFEFIETNIEKRNGSTLSLSSTMWLYADNKIVERIPHRQKSALKENESITIPCLGTYKFGNKEFTIKPYDTNNLIRFPNSNENYAYVDMTKISYPLTLRYRSDGDTIQPFGMTGTMKLKKYLNSKGVSKHMRDDIPLLCDKSDVLWATGVGISGRIGADGLPTHILEIK